MLGVANRRGISKSNGFPQLLIDPKLYITIALFAGEAGPAVLKSSGWMYIFGLVGLLLMLVKIRIDVRKHVSIVLLIYMIVLIRNISVNDEVLYFYELPNLGTAILILLLDYFFYKDEDIETIEKYIFIYAALLALLGTYRFIRNPSERLAVFGGPNGYYKIALLFEVLCFYRYLCKKRKVYLFGAILGLILCMATGSKGGIVSMAVILLLEVVFYIFNAGERRKYLIKRFLQIILVLVLGCILIRFAVNRIPGLSAMLARANVFLYRDSFNNLTSVNARTDLIVLGIRFFKESPIIGKGARYTYFYTGGAQPYSHNLFVEFLSENGLIATIPLVVFFAGIFINTIKYGKRDARLFSLFLCIAVYLSGSLFSGNILDAKPIFVFGVMFANYIYNKNHCFGREIWV